MTKNKTLSRAQKALSDLLATPAQGFEVEVIEQDGSYCGVTEALRHAERSSKSGLACEQAHVCTAEGGSAQETVRMFARTTNTKGADMGTRLAKVIEALSAAHSALDTQHSVLTPRAVTLVFDEAKNIKQSDLLKLIHSASHTASHLDIDLRIVFVIGRVPKYDFKKRGYYEADYPAMWSMDTLRMQFSSHARVWSFNGKSLAQRKPVRAWIDEADEAQRQPLLRDLKTGTHG